MTQWGAQIVRDGITERFQLFIRRLKPRILPLQFLLGQLESGGAVLDAFFQFQRQGQHFAISFSQFPL